MRRKGIRRCGKQLQACDRGVSREFGEGASDVPQLSRGWLAVEGQAMNIEHRAKTAFENEAVAALKAGKQQLVQMAEEVYR